MERDGRNEKGDVGETNELIVDDDNVVRRYDSFNMVNESSKNGT
jgi:hypothetical protein